MGRIRGCASLPDVCRDDAPDVPKTRSRTRALIDLSPEDVPEDPSRPGGGFAFDFDGTMTVRARFTPSLGWRAAHAKLAPGLPALGARVGRA